MSKKTSRRQFVSALGSAYAGLSLPGILKARAAASPAPGTIRSCIFMFCYGGPSHIDTFDLKPDASADTRGEFRPIATTVPGIHVCEHLPKMARLAHKFATIRSIHHANRAHDAASVEALTGRPPLDGDGEFLVPEEEFFPCYGSTLSYIRRKEKLAVSHASLPWVFFNDTTPPCQGAGFLGQTFDPFLITGDPERINYRSEILRVPEGLSLGRIRNRMSLLDGLETHSAASMIKTPAMKQFNAFYRRAFELLHSNEVRVALEIEREDRRTRDRYGWSKDGRRGQGNGAEMGYGRNLRGQNLLMARRLVEAGVPFVNVYDYKQQGQNWDSHKDNFSQHKDYLLPMFDQSVSALIEDLEERGLLETTLVVVTGEFGRTPKINKQSGRDHWPDCYTVLLAGGGVTGGAVYGASDVHGAYPVLNPVTPADLAATIFWRFGIDHKTEIHDRLGQPYALADGEPIRELFA